MQLLQEQIQVSAQQIRLYSFVKWQALFTYVEIDLQPLQSSLLKNFTPYQELMQILESFNLALRVFKQEGHVPQQAVLRHQLCQQISKLLRLAVKAPTKLHQENMTALIHSKLKIFFPNQPSLKAHSSVSQRNPQPQSKTSSKPRQRAQQQNSLISQIMKGGHRPLTGVTRHSSTYSRARAVSTTRPQTGLTRANKQCDQNQLTQLNITNIQGESQVFEQYRAADFFCQEKREFSEGCRTSHHQMEIPAQRIQQYQRKTLNKFAVPVVQIKQKIVPTKSQTQPTPIQPIQPIEPVPIQPIKVEGLEGDPLLQLEGNNQGEPLLEQQLGDQQQGQAQEQLQQKNRLAPKTKPFLTDLPPQTQNSMMPLKTYLHHKHAQVEKQIDQQLILLKKQNAKFRSRVQSQMGRKLQSSKTGQESRREQCAQKQICQDQLKHVLHQNYNLVKLDHIQSVPISNRDKSLTKYSCSKAKPFSAIIKQANLTFNEQQEDQTFQVKSKAAKNKSYFALDVVQKGICRPQYDPKDIYKESGITGMFLLSNPFFPKKKKKSKKKSKK